LQNSLMAHQNSVTLEQLIYVRLEQQKKQLIDNSGLMEQYRVVKERMASVLTQIIRISIDTIN